MKNNFTSTFGLPFIVYLKRDREAKIDSQINNLKLSDVEKDENFNNSIIRIKESVKLKPVEIGPGRYVDHEFEQRKMTMEMQLMGAPSSFYHHEIVFPVTGATELFSHIPENGFSVMSSDRGIILPRGVQLTVYSSLPTLENEKAVTHADQLLRLTKQLINSNNADIIQWNAAIESRIDQQAQAKRKELIEKFGTK